MIKDRPKAQDIFNSHNFIFAPKVTFEEAFPRIEDLRIEVEETDLSRTIHKSTYDRASFPGEYVNCTNELCYNGGFSIGRIVRQMVSENKMEYTGDEYCRGYEGSPKGKKRYRSCVHSFDVKVIIKYKTESERPSSL